MSNENHIWTEESHLDVLKLSYKTSKKLFSKKSKFQLVEVIENPFYGRMLLNDNIVMISEKDEFIYHEMISHVPMFTHPNPKKVLIIGGGDGGTAREVLKHACVEKCTMVEIDELVVNACKEYIPQTAIAFQNPKLNLIIDDGVNYVANSKEKFDIVLIDSTDPIGPATPLFNETFYTNVKNILNENGIVVAQGESPFYEEEMQIKMLNIYRSLFKNVNVYLYNNLTYPGALWSFWFASKGLSPISNFDPNRINRSEIIFKYYNEKIHKASFALPQFYKEKIKQYIGPEQ